MTSESDTEIERITIDPAIQVNSDGRDDMRRLNFVIAVDLLDNLGVEFDFPIDELIQSKCTATLIYIGSWSRELYGSCLYGDVASLEDESDSKNDVSFKTFPSLVEYVKGVIAEHKVNMSMVLLLNKLRLSSSKIIK